MDLEKTFYEFSAGLKLYFVVSRIMAGIPLLDSLITTLVFNSFSIHLEIYSRVSMERFGINSTL